MFDQRQLLKGTLEGCILKIIEAEETYGYEIVSQLRRFGFEDAKEGTIYPILLRLEKKELIDSTYKASPLGPKRKYYGLSKKGKEFLMEFEENWNQVKDTVDTILKGEK